MKQKLTSVQVIEIKQDQDNQRVDNYLQRLLTNVPKTRIYRLIRKGEIRVNKSRIKINHRLKAGDMIRIPPIRLEESAPQRIPDTQVQSLRQRILFENDDVLVVDKPAGLAVHAGSGLHYGLIDVARQLRPSCSFLELAHRLDRETSGCLLLVKNRQTLNAVQQLFKTGQVIKKYLAAVIGHWNDAQTIDIPLRKNAIKGGERVVEEDPDGKTAISHFRPLQHYRGVTLMEVELDTGRTHQIRVHAAGQGHPLAGDLKYGSREDNRRFRELGLERLFLHAHWLELHIPGWSEAIQVNTPLPPELNQVLNHLCKK